MCRHFLNQERTLNCFLENNLGGRGWRQTVLKIKNNMFLWEFFQIVFFERFCRFDLHTYLMTHSRLRIQSVCLINFLLSVFFFSLLGCGLLFKFVTNELFWNKFKLIIFFFWVFTDFQFYTILYHHSDKYYTKIKTTVCSI